MIVKCVSNDFGFEGLITVGNTYNVLVDSPSSYVIVNDKGGKGMFPKYLFDVVGV